MKIEEKPANPRSFYAVTSMYFYDAHVFDVIKTLEPLGRDRVLITDLEHTAACEEQLVESTMGKGPGARSAKMRLSAPAWSTLCAAHA